MITTRLLRAAEAVSAAGKTIFNPYKARKPWPPDFAKLDPKYQFRLERRYRRRTKLKWARPRWVRGVKLTQWGICLSVFAYGVLYMDFGTNDNPFGGVRDWFGAQFRSVWTTEPTSQSNATPGDTALQAPSSKSTVSP